LALVLAGCGGFGPGTEGQKPAPSTPSPTVCAAGAGDALAPESGALFGVNLDWANQSLAGYAADLGRKPAVAVSFTEFPYDQADRANLQAAVEQIRGDGRAMLLTLEPHEGLRVVTDQAVKDLATDLKEFNDAGVPVIVRFAHEMNGSWYAWSQQPKAYIAAFRKVADAVHGDAPGSSMMWAPNYGGGYPFTGGKHGAKAGTADFLLLDTNDDGVLTMADDPYAPYYPGDEAVDWVGMSLYHWGAAHPWGENEVPEPGKFTDQLTGAYAGLGGDDTAVPDFYADYAQERGKPLAIPETAALYVEDGGGASEAEIKQAWWEQLFAADTARDFPQLRMLNWFEWHKHETEIGGDVDWRAAGDPEIRSAFRDALPSWLRYGPAEGTCAGG
jgi:hypothetical protein